MKKSTVDDTIKTWLKEEYGWDDDEIKAFLKNFHKDVKEKDKEDDEGDNTLRSGTTCLGIVNTAHKKTIFEG